MTHFGQNLKKVLSNTLLGLVSNVHIIIDMLLKYIPFFNKTIKSQSN